MASLNRRVRQTKTAGRPKSPSPNLIILKTCFRMTCSNWRRHIRSRRSSRALHRISSQPIFGGSGRTPPPVRPPYAKPRLGSMRLTGSMLNSPSCIRLSFSSPGSPSASIECTTPLSPPRTSRSTVCIWRHPSVSRSTDSVTPSSTRSRVGQNAGISCHVDHLGGLVWLQTLPAASEQRSQTCSKPCANGRGASSAAEKKFRRVDGFASSWDGVIDLRLNWQRSRRDCSRINLSHVCDLHSDWTDDSQFFDMMESTAATPTQDLNETLSSSSCSQTKEKLRLE